MKKATILEFDKILGLRLSESGKYEATDIPPEIKDFVRKRETLRSQRKWRESDDAREKISRLGYDVDDTSGGSRIKKKQ